MAHKIALVLIQGHSSYCQAFLMQ